MPEKVPRVAIIWTFQRSWYRDKRLPVNNHTSDNVCGELISPISSPPHHRHIDILSCYVQYAIRSTTFHAGYMRYTVTDTRRTESACLQQFIGVAVFDQCVFSRRHPAYPVSVPIQRGVIGSRQLAPCVSRQGEGSRCACSRQEYVLTLLLVVHLLQALSSCCQHDAFRKALTET